MNHKRKKPDNKKRFRYYTSQSVWHFKKSFKKDYLDKKEFARYTQLLKNMGVL